MKLRTNDHTLQLQTIEAHFQPQSNEDRYATANKWSTLCKCKQMKHTQYKEKNYAMQKWCTLYNSK